MRSAVGPNRLKDSIVPSNQTSIALLQNIGASVGDGIKAYQSHKIKDQLLGQARQATAAEQEAQLQQGQVDLAERQQVEQTQQQANQKREEIQRQSTWKSITSNPELASKFMTLQNLNPQMAQGVANILLSRDQAEIEGMQQEAIKYNTFARNVATMAADPKISDEQRNATIKAYAAQQVQSGGRVDEIANLMGMNRDEIYGWGAQQMTLSNETYQIGEQSKEVLGISKIDPEVYTPQSLQEFNSTGNYSALKRIQEVKEVGGDIGTPSPKDFTVESIAEYKKTGEPSVLKRFHSETAKRGQRVIVQGITAAQGMPTIKRSIDLLKEIKTGGYASVALKVKQAFGVEGADEAELSANLGRSVLGQLKDIFGSQFTDKEGLRLEKIEANFGKSPEGNLRILNQLYKMSELKVRQGRARAVAEEDEATVAEIDEYMNFQLTDEAANTDDDSLFGKYGGNE